MTNVAKSVRTSVIAVCATLFFSLAAFATPDFFSSNAKVEIYV
jgi:hypothetical protein